VPLLQKDAVRGHPREFLSERAERGFWRRTGGSTGPPTRIYLGSSAHREMLNAKYRFYADWNLDLFDRFAFLWGHRGSFAAGLEGWRTRLAQRSCDALRNRLRLSVYHLGKDDLCRYLRRLRQFQPAALYGYASAVFVLAAEAIATDFRCDSLKAAILTSEPVFPHMAETVRRAFSVPAVIEYGAAECDLIAAQLRSGGLQVREDLVFVETLPRDDSRFDIAITVLNNPSFPLIRYRIGDISEAPLRTPARGFAQFQQVLGRCNDFLLSRTGRRIHAAYLIETLKHAGEIGRYRARQAKSGAIDIDLEVRGPREAFDVERAARRLTEVLEGFPTRIRIVGSVAQTEAGKHRWIVSEMESDGQFLEVST
jgi:phenylacetate-CoA ligase